MNVVEELDAAARERGGDVALYDLKQRNTLSFAEFADRVNGAAAFLLRRGVGRGDRVLSMVRPGMELILSVFSALKIGAVPLVIDPGMGLKNFLNGVRRSTPRFLIATPRVLIAKFLFFRTFRRMIGLDIRGLMRGVDSSAILTEQLSPDETAAVLFTSGSTGPPKGVCYTHRHFYAQLGLLGENFNVAAGEVDFPLLPIFALFNPALRLSTVVPEMDARRPSELNARAAVDHIEQFKVTNSFGSPRLWTKIADDCEARRRTLPSLKRIFVAGAPASPQLLRRLQSLVVNGEVYTPYGATEALPLSAISAREILAHTLPLTLSGRGTCVGRPLPSIQIRVLRLDCSEILEPPHAIGEIVAAGPVVTEHYDRDPEAEKRAKIWIDGRCWHRMGDLGYFDDENRLWFCGRAVESVVVGDKTWYTECCEPIFNIHPKVFRSALIHIRNERLDAPAVVVEPLAPPSRQEWLNFRRELCTLARSCETTGEIHLFFWHRKFPVDIRHNAKIHRLTLARYFSRRLGEAMQN